MKILIFNLIIWSILICYILKWLNNKIQLKFFFDSYKKISKIVLDKYGDYPIKRIYLSKRPVPLYLRVMLDIITCKSYSKQLKNYRKTFEVPDFYPMHTYMIIEIKLKNKLRKWIIVEKHNSIDITPYFMYSSNQDIMELKLNKKDKFTINKILNLTKDNMGSNLFYNWHFYNNNCQKFILEILESINKNNIKYQKFIYQKKFTETVKFSDLSLYLANNLNNLYNLVENLYYDILL